MNTLLVLMDFNGHPDFTTDPITDIIRYSNLTDILYNRSIDRQKFHIFTTKIAKKDRKLFDIKEQCIKRGNKFVEAEVDYSIENGIKDLEYAFDMDMSWQIIIGGTNTSGCVYKNHSLGAYYWHKAGYKTAIYTPICGEYQAMGINDFEKNTNGLTHLFNDMIDDDSLDHANQPGFGIRLVNEIRKLNLPYSNKSLNRSYVHDTLVSLPKK